MSTKHVIWLGLVLLAVIGAGTPGRTQDATLQAACSPTIVRGVVTPPDQDLKYGQCLFSSTVDFQQANPGSVFASCSGCHPNNRTDAGTHPVLITFQGTTSVDSRQVPNLLNVAFNVPLGWDGRHGGVLGDQPSIIAAIKRAATGAINSPVEMAGQVDATLTADQNKLSALAAFILSRSPTIPDTTTPLDPPLDATTLAHIKVGSDVFFGRSASTSGLLQAGKACVSCHVPPFFTDNKIRTNVLNPDAAYEFGFVHADGSVGPLDAGAGLTTVSDPQTGRSVQVGTFKTPSLHRFYPDGEPAFHNGVFGRDDRLFHFYEKSLGFTLAAGESTGLHYWLIHCPQGPDRNPANIPIECGITPTVPSPAMSLDLPGANTIAHQPFIAAGWAIDRGAASGTGVDAVHVWATPVGGSPVFLGIASYGLARADVGSAFSAQFTNSGFVLSVHGLSPGPYDLLVFAHSAVSGTFNQTRSVRVLVQ